MVNRRIESLLRPNEELVAAVNPSWLYYRYRLLLSGVLVFTAFFLLYPLQTFGRIGWVVFAALLAIAIFGIVRVVIMRSLQLFVVTSQRIIDIEQRTLFERHVSDCELVNIRDVRYNMKGVIATIFRVGNVIIDANNFDGHFALIDIPHPAKIKEHIMHAQRHSSKPRRDTQDQLIVDDL